MSLRLFPARAAIGVGVDKDGRQISIFSTPEFNRALSALLVRVGGETAISTSDVEILLSFIAPPNAEADKAIHDLQIESARDHSAEIAELRKTVDELKAQLACMTDQSAAVAEVGKSLEEMGAQMLAMSSHSPQVAEVKKYAQSLEIAYSFVPPPPDWEHPGSIGAKTANAGAFTTLTASSTCTIDGAFGCNGATAQTAYTLPVDATDLASAITLANETKALLIANGSGA